MGISVFLFCRSKNSWRASLFFASHEHLLPPDTTGIIRLRFVTTFDFPPFNFLDKTGYLAGYHIDLLRAICSKLNLEKLCEVEVVPWEELVEHVKDGGAEVIIAGLKETSKTHQDLVFTKSYLRFPARFVASRLVNFDEPISDKLTYLSSGVLFKSAHENSFVTIFPKLNGKRLKIEQNSIKRSKIIKLILFLMMDLLYHYGSMIQNPMIAAILLGVHIWVPSYWGKECVLLLQKERQVN